MICRKLKPPKRLTCWKRLLISHIAISVCKQIPDRRRLWSRYRKKTKSPSLRRWPSADRQRRWAMLPNIRHRAEKNPLKFSKSFISPFKIHKDAITLKPDITDPALIFNEVIMRKKKKMIIENFEDKCECREDDKCGCSFPQQYPSRLWRRNFQRKPPAATSFCPKNNPYPGGNVAAVFLCRVRICTPANNAELPKTPDTPIRQP